MHEAIAPPLEAWGNFYVIVGSSAGALTGLQFVVLTLVAQSGPVRSREETISAFGSPNVVHFCAALLIAAILSAPWAGLRPAGLAVAGCGVLGIVYSAIVLKRAVRQSAYQAVFEDWLWHTILPTLAYVALFVAGAVLMRSPVGGLFVIGAALLLLVFIGIHNAWDTVTYITMRAAQETEAGTGGGAYARSGNEAARSSGPGSSSASGLARAGESVAARTEPGSPRSEAPDAP